MILFAGPEKAKKDNRVEATPGRILQSAESMRMNFLYFANLSLPLIYVVRYYPEISKKV